MVNVEQIYVEVDDFRQPFLPVWETQWPESGERQRRKPSRLSVSEVMMLLLLFHQYRFRDFKTFETRFPRPGKLHTDVKLITKGIGSLMRLPETRTWKTRWYGLY